MSVVIVAAASATRSHSSAAQELVVAIVDPHRTTADRNDFRAHVAAQMQAIVTDVYGGATAMRPVYVGARDARLKLQGGDYDAALVLGEDRPLALRRLNLTAVAGTMTVHGNAQPVSLIIAAGDAEMNGRLRQVFNRLLTPEPLRVPLAQGPGKLATR